MPQYAQPFTLAGYSGLGNDAPVENGGALVIGDFNSYSPVDAAPGSPTQPDYAGGAASAEERGWEPLGYLLDINCIMQ